MSERDTINAPSRRGALGMLLGFGCSTGLAFGPTNAFAQASVAIPQGPMRLTRRFEHSLRGGASLTVTRHWQIEFFQQGRGIAVSGEQLSAEVDAPSNLSALAEIEQSRSTAQMWPILMGRDGRIVATGDGTQTDDVEEALQEAEQIIAQHGIHPADRAMHQRYLREIENVGASLLDRLPNDLFFPEGTPQRIVRSLELAQDMTGEFELTYNAIKAANCDWLANAERRVTTRIGDNVKRAHEEWSLSEV